MGAAYFKNMKDFEGKIECCKCKDRYKPFYGGKSQRTSCRYHNYVRTANGGKICLDCKYHGRGGRNCYHMPY